MEPQFLEVMAQVRAARLEAPYVPRTDAQVVAMLERAFDADGLADVKISGLERMSGGASKEQFVFRLTRRDDVAGERFVLRLDPGASILHSSRAREAQLQAAAAAAQYRTG